MDIRQLLGSPLNFGGLTEPLAGVSYPNGIAPDGMDPNAQAQMTLRNMGAGMLANSRQNPMQALGMSYLQAQNQGLDNARQTMLAKEFKSKEDERKANSERQNAWKQWVAGNKDKFGQYGDMAEYLDPGDALRLLSTGEEPASVQEYKYAMENGFTGSFADWKSLNKQGTTVNVNTGDNAFNKKSGEIKATNYEAAVEDGKKQRVNLALLDQAEKALDSGIYTGFGGNAVGMAMRVAPIFGIDPGNVKDMDTFAALSKQSTMQELGGLGAQISNSDRDFIEGTQFNLWYSNAGNREIIKVKKRLAKFKIEYAKRAQEYVKKNGTLDEEFDLQFSEWADQNPIFTPDVMPSGNAPSGGGESDPLGIRG